MAIVIYTGLPGNGKGIKLAETVLNLLEKNVGFFKKTGTKRKIFSNVKFSKDLEQKYEGYISYWIDPMVLTQSRDCDVIFDEMATYCDSTQYAMLPLEFKRMLQQHRKRGIDIYGATQDFAMIDISIRRVASRVIYCKKVAGSRDLSATRPNPKWVWGICRYREVDRRSFSSGQDEYVFTDSLGEFQFITKKLCDVYDTTQELESVGYPPLRHIKRECKDCTFTKTIHT